MTLEARKTRSVALEEERAAIERAYDGSTAVFRALQALGWGPLLNFGYFRLHEFPLLLFGLKRFLRRLAKNSTDLLEVKTGDRVLDVACGQGWTTQRLAEQGARAYGIDLLEQHVELSRQRFGSHPGVRFAVGDATDLLASAETLGLAPGSLDGIHCLQAAFQFGSEGRRAFLADAFRLLRPGGRLVLVDFTWRSDRPEEIEELDPDRLIRDTWRFERFEPFEVYRRALRDVGFRERRVLDWSRPVVDRFQAACTILSTLGRFKPNRKLLTLIYPGLASLAPEDWGQLADVTRAHNQIRRQTLYAAFVLEKP